MKTIGLLLALFSLSALAKDFERFDGQTYNGLYYPLVDNIEWGEQDGEEPHMEFHMHSKHKAPMDVAVVPGEKGGRPVFWIMYLVKSADGSRNEKVCRHVLAPKQFRKGMKVYAYRDNTDPDYDNVFFYSEPPKKLLSAKAVDGKRVPVPAYTMPAYERCLDENASNMPYEEGEAPLKHADAPATTEPAQVRDPASAAGVKGEALPARDGKGVPIDYDNTAVPFSF
jgi:hypothetical protein